MSDENSTITFHFEDDPDTVLPEPIEGVQNTSTIPSTNNNLTRKTSSEYVYENANTSVPAADITHTTIDSRFFQPPTKGEKPLPVNNVPTNESVLSAPAHVTSAKHSPSPPPANGHSAVELQPLKPAAAAATTEAKVDEIPANEDENTPVQFLSVPGLGKRYQTPIDAIPKQSSGLTHTEAMARLIRDGRNELTPPKEKPEWLKYLLCFTDPFMLLLIIAGILSAAIAYPLKTEDDINLWIGIVLWVVVFISSTFSYIQEGKASAVMKGFKNMLPRQCHVVRDGHLQDIPAAELVVGDLVRVGTGDQVPADLRIIYSSECKVEVSSLTGESLPITVSVYSKEEKLEQARNIMFNTSKCVEGEAYGIVFATGDNTLIGRIANMASVPKTEDTPIQVEVKYFVRRITTVALILGFIFFWVGFGRSGPSNWISAFINGFIVVMIACVPEGLPMTVVSALTLTAKRLGSMNVFIKQLNSVETLGSCTVIASDKTGTLTQNKMTVSRLWFDGMPMTSETAIRDLSSHSAHLTHSANRPTTHTAAETLEALELVAAVCNRCRFEDQRELTDEQAQQIEAQMVLRRLDPSMTLRSAKAAFPTVLARVDNNLTMNSARSKIYQQLGAEMMDDTQRKTIGDASETALFNFIRMRQSIELIRYHHPAVFEVPFNSRNKYAITISKFHRVKGESADRRMLMMKGAPEVILARCSHYMERGQRKPMTEEFKQQFQRTYELFAGFGERVLGFANLDLDPQQYGAKYDTQYSLEEQNFPTSGLTFVGLMSLVDPPKETVPGAIEACRTAGVRVIMVTGDHPLTAAAIARQVGIITVPTRDEIAKAQDIPPSEVSEDLIDAVVVNGQELDKFTEADWTRVLTKQEIVFARTTPQQKLEIVSHLQQMGEVVAATGDGVNDSPALKKADIGVAMGISGSDVARDAAAVILMDDDFSSIVVGIREGRTIFMNLSKTVAYTLTHMVPEIIPVLCALCFGLPLGLSAIQILCIDLGTELFPAISLAYEPAEFGIMNVPPRNSKTDRLVTGRIAFYFIQIGIIETITAGTAFFLTFHEYGFTPSDLWNTTNYFVSGADDYMGYTAREQTDILARAQTSYFVMLTTTQIFNIFCCKTKVVSIFTHGLTNNAMLIYGVVIEMALILFITFFPFSHRFFQTLEFPDRFWAIMVMGQFTVLFWTEFRKYMSRTHPGGFIDRWFRW